MPLQEIFDLYEDLPVETEQLIRDMIALVEQNCGKVDTPQVTPEPWVETQTTNTYPYVTYTQDGQQFAVDSEGNLVMTIPLQGMHTPRRLRRRKHRGLF
jgi:hypothetical protein